MAINKNNVEIKITLSKDQLKWLEKTSKKLNITKSKFIAWCLSKKANELYELIYMKNNKLTDEELENIISIAKTRWL